MSGPSGVTSEQFAGRYTIERELGRGATATVYLARDPERGRTVAIKLLRPELAASTAAKQFVREIRRTSGLQHPRIVPVLDAGEHGGQLYCVLPYMDGGTLRHRLLREKQLPVSDAVGIARAVADALDYAHQRGLIHRDVKPENILFTGGEACLADFGIARALEKSAGDTSTSRGIVRGTMAYMSPEQASGEHEYDGRSDVFALGCVLYEMLAGVPAFVGATPEAALAQRFAHSPRDVRIYRPNIPDELEAVVRKALQFAPADRYRSAGAMAAALRQVEIAIETMSSAQRLVSTLRKRGRERLLVLAAAGALVLIAGIALVTVDRQGGRGVPGGSPDTTRLVVLPFERTDGADDRRLDDDLLHDALSSWRGIGVVDRFQVADAIARRAPNRSHGTLSALATSLGAGRYVRGQIASSGDSLLAYAAVFDVTSPDALHQASVGVPLDAVLAARSYARLAAALLLRVSPTDVAASELGTPRSVPAMQAFGRGQRALDGWDLAAADSAFESAVTFDPEYTRAYLWLAQVRSWRELRTTVWKSVAERALAGASALPDRERRLAEASVFLANQRFLDACAVYDDLLRQNDRDFAAWFGLGECRRMDPVVVADATSPSGWRFRSSYHRAIEAYTGAFEVLPTVHRGYSRGVFERLRTLLLLTTQLKPGLTLPDSAPFLARPAWIGDTLALIPYPAHLVYAGGPQVVPPGFAEALARQRAVFHRIASGWSAAYPASSGAKRAVALSLELLGDPSAIDTLRLARRLATDSLRRAELAAAEVLLLVKFSAPDDARRLQAARALADSLLSSRFPTSRAEAVALAPLASLLGRCAMGEQLARAAAPPEGWLNIRGRHVADAQALLARTSLGCEPGPTTPGLAALTAALARDFPNVRERRRAEIVLLFRPALASAELDSALLDRLAAASGHQLLRAASAASKGDRAGVRSALTAFASGWSDAAGPVTPDMAYPGARLWVSIGDTAAAIRWLDRTLGALRDFDPGVLTDPATVAALVRAIVLRAELAGGVGDTASARRWGSAAVALWTDADAELKAPSGGGSPFSRF